MEVYPIMFIHQESGIVGMWEEVFTTEQEAFNKIAELEKDEMGFEYQTQKLNLVFEVQ